MPAVSLLGLLLSVSAVLWRTLLSFVVHFATETGETTCFSHGVHCRPLDCRCFTHCLSVCTFTCSSALLHLPLPLSSNAVFLTLWINHWVTFLLLFISDRCASAVEAFRGLFNQETFYFYNGEACDTSIVWRRLTHSSLLIFILLPHLMLLQSLIFHFTLVFSLVIFQLSASLIKDAVCGAFLPEAHDRSQQQISARRCRDHRTLYWYRSLCTQMKTSGSRQVSEIWRQILNATHEFNI